MLVIDAVMTVAVVIIVMFVIVIVIVVLVIKVLAIEVSGANSCSIVVVSALVEVVIYV